MAWGDPRIGLDRPLPANATDQVTPKLEPLRDYQLSLIAPTPPVGSGGRARVERARPHQAQYVLKLEGVDDRTQAEAEVGGNLFVDLTRLDVELPDRILPFQVIGSIVRTEDGRVIGRVSNVLQSSAQPIYQGTREAGAVLIPAVPAFIVRRENGEITVRPIPGLLDG